MYVQRGQVRVMIEGAETTYTQGNLCLLNRNTMHRETDMSNADIVYIGIDASLLTQWPKSFPPPFQYKSILNQFSATICRNVPTIKRTTWTLTF